jgi:hypothetical protein
MTASLNNKKSFFRTENIASQSPRQTVERSSIQSKTHTKPINTLYEKNVEFLNINVINSDRVKLTGQEGRKKDEKVNKNINSKPERNRVLEISSYIRSWEDNIKLYLQHTGCGNVKSIHPAENRDQRWAVKYTIMNHQYPTSL